MQPYLRSNNILTVVEKKEIFSYRTRMNSRKYKFQGNKENEYCVTIMIFVIVVRDKYIYHDYVSFM